MMKQRKGLTTHRQSELKKTSKWATVGLATDDSEFRNAFFLTLLLKTGVTSYVVAWMLQTRIYDATFDLQGKCFPS